MDFCQGFDHLCMSWVRRVLKKGVDSRVLERIKRLHERGTTRVSVNNILGESIKNLMESLRQGDLPSMIWFVLAMYPLLVSLKILLKGIETRSVTAEGPYWKGK